MFKNGLHRIAFTLIGGRTGQIHKLIYLMSFSIVDFEKLRGIISERDGYITFWLYVLFSFLLWSHMIQIVCNNKKKKLTDLIKENKKNNFSLEIWSINIGKWYLIGYIHIWRGLNDADDFLIKRGLLITSPKLK